MYDLQVTPFKRFLGQATETTEVGVEKRKVTTTRDVYMYDIPLEQSLQRELHYNPDFARHFRDFGDIPRQEGMYTGAQDHSAA